MFNFGQDIGIDLGTATVIAYVKGKGIVLREPSVVAVDNNTSNVLAVGKEARRMLGRTPGNIVATRPLREGVISNYTVTEKMLKYFINKVCGKFIFSPRIMICIPSQVTEVEKRAVIDAASQAGARRVYLIEEPIAAAIGAGAQYFTETVINGKKFNEVNWTKVAIMSVSGAVGAAIPCAGVAGYFAAGLVGGLTSGIMTAIDGGSSQEILLSSVKGATISVLTHGLFSSCFVGGTKVLTDKGLINIEDIRKGMYVLSYNEILGITEYKKVIETYDNKSTYFTDLTLENGETITSIPLSSAPALIYCFNLGT